MRITNSLLRHETRAGIQRQLGTIHEAYRRAITGRRVERPSDDPVAAGSIMRMDSRLRAVEQYGRNIDSARSRLAAEEDVLGHLTDILTRAKELAVASASDTSDPEARGMARAEVEQLLGNVIQLANTRIDGSYLFGGNHPDQPPLDDDGATDPARPPVGVRSVEAGDGFLVEVAHDAQTTFVDNGVVSALQQLADALDANDTAAVQAAIPAIDDAFTATQNLFAEVGARVNVLDAAEAQLATWRTHLEGARSDLSDIEMEEAISSLIDRQTAYQAALLANSRIIQTSLTDYLR